MAKKSVATSHDAPLTRQRHGQVEVRIGQEKADLLPHEQDESATSQTTSQPRKIMKQAATDIGRGLVDTDRGVPADKAYAKQKI